jgi:septal ring factor EnvC (AmiA/AmiB activator)
MFVAPTAMLLSQRRARLAYGLLAAAWLCAPAHAIDLSVQQNAALERRGELRERIDKLQLEIDQRESDRKDAADALKGSEAAISQINRRLGELNTASREAQTQLDTLLVQIGEQERVLAKRRDELAGQLRAQYRSGLSPWTALLSGDEPQALGRNLGYLQYVSQARTRVVQMLQVDVERLAALQKQADGRSVRLKTVAEETVMRKAELQTQQKVRATVLAQLEGQIAAQRFEAVKLGRDDQRLSRLISGLEQAIADQSKREQQARRVAADAARQRAEEIRRQAEAARAAEEVRQAAETQRLAQAQALVEAARREARAAQAADVERRSAESARRAQWAVEAARDAARAREQAAAEIERAKVEARVGTIEVRGPLIASEARGSLARAPMAAEGAESGRGLTRKMRPPVAGEVQGRFGVGRPDGGAWRGIVLRAAEGTPVQAVAAGSVVYANWLRGFGNIIIVDHGDHYLSVYGYNQSLSKQVGDRVGQGEIIAAVGATGGQVESGLYFEIRHQGAPVDPAQWLAL